ncbi:MAG TPA: hypothetical protein VGH23_01560 [Rhizomicrobium sp.]|jgi:hypothetical protein
MEVENLFQKRVREAEERAALAPPNSEERRIWTEIAAEYRQLAEETAKAATGVVEN